MNCPIGKNRWSQNLGQLLGLHNYCGAHNGRRSLVAFTGVEVFMGLKVQSLSCFETGTKEEREGVQI